jgi:hypothetical protein
MTEPTKRGATDAIPQPSRASPDPETASPATPIAATTSDPVPSSAVSVVDDWFRVTFPGSALVQTTEQWNFLVKAVDELRALLGSIK